MTRDELIAALAKLVAGLQVPMSMGMPLGAAHDPLRQIHAAVGGGWLNENEVAEYLRSVL